MNCVVYGDLCEEHGIKYYPQLNLYKNGEFVEEFSKTRDYEHLTKYMDEHAEPKEPKKKDEGVKGVVAGPTTTKNGEVVPTTPVLHVQTSRSEVNPSGTVLSLTPGNFQDVITQGPAFIKYFAPWYV